MIEEKSYDMFAAAIALAAVKHSTQTRKNGVTPYIYHPIAVAELVRDAGYGLEYQTVAMLHDVLEDTDADEGEMAIFGEDILIAVKLLTRPEGADEAKYVANILENPLARVVKNADKICNLRDAILEGEAGAPRSKRAKSFAERYIKKAEDYYMGHFSEALDSTIVWAKEQLLHELVPEKHAIPRFTKEYLRF